MAISDTSLKQILVHAGLALAMILPSVSAQADIYQWVDAQGNVVFGDNPEANQDATLIKTDKELERENQTFGINNKHLNGQSEFLKSAEERRIKQKEREAKKKEQAQKQARACKQLQAKLKHRERVNRLYHYTEDGDVRYLSDEERKVADQKLQQMAQEVCKKSS